MSDENPIYGGNSGKDNPLFDSANQNPMHTPSETEGEMPVSFVRGIVKFFKKIAGYV